MVADSPAYIKTSDGIKFHFLEIFYPPKYTSYFVHSLFYFVDKSYDSFLLCILFLVLSSPHRIGLRILVIDDIDVGRCWRLFMIKLWNHGLLDARTMNNCNVILEKLQNQEQQVEPMRS